MEQPHKAREGKDAQPVGNHSRERGFFRHGAVNLGDNGHHKGGGRGTDDNADHKPQARNSQRCQHCPAQQRMHHQLAKDKPGINKLIRSFEDNRAAFLPDNDSPKSKKKKKNTETEEEEKAGNVVQYRDKDAVLSGLEQTLPYLRGKDRADVLMKIADLQQMKKDENTEEEETVHYYLPLQCYRCSLFIADRAKRKAEEAEKPDNI